MEETREVNRKKNGDMVTGSFQVQPAVLHSCGSGPALLPSTEQ